MLEVVRLKTKKSEIGQERGYLFWLYKDLDCLQDEWDARIWLTTFDDELRILCTNILDKVDMVLPMSFKERWVEYFPDIFEDNVEMLFAFGSACQNQKSEKS